MTYPVVDRHKKSVTHARFLSGGNRHQAITILRHLILLREDRIDEPVGFFFADTEEFFDHTLSCIEDVIANEIGDEAYNALHYGGRNEGP